MFFCRKDITEKRGQKKKERKKVTAGWTGISGPGPASIFIQKFNILQYIDST